MVRVELSCLINFSTHFVNKNTITSNLFQNRYAAKFPISIIFLQFSFDFRNYQEAITWLKLAEQGLDDSPISQTVGTRVNRAVMENATSNHN